jgi:hypothetical protein
MTKLARGFPVQITLNCLGGGSVNTLPLRRPGSDGAIAPEYGHSRRAQQK